MPSWRRSSRRRTSPLAPFSRAVRTAANRSRSASAADQAISARSRRAALSSVASTCEFHQARFVSTESGASVASASSTMRSASLIGAAMLATVGGNYAISAANRPLFPRRAPVRTRSAPLRPERRSAARGGRHRVLVDRARSGPSRADSSCGACTRRERWSTTSARHGRSTWRGSTPSSSALQPEPS